MKAKKSHINFIFLRQNIHSDMIPIIPSEETAIFFQKRLSDSGSQYGDHSFVALKPGLRQEFCSPPTQSINQSNERRYDCASPSSRWRSRFKRSWSWTPPVKPRKMQLRHSFPNEKPALFALKLKLEEQIKRCLKCERRRKANEVPKC